MSGDEYTPLHWQPDLGGAQAEENLSLLEWAQRTRPERMGEAATPEPDPDPAEAIPEPPDPAHGHGCAR